MKKIDEVVNDFVADMRGANGGALRSVVLYGSAVTDDFVAERSDFNFVVVLTEVSHAALDRMSPLAKRWHKRRISTPIVVDPQFLPAALDSYPIEILSMKAKYRVLEGPDPLAELRPETRDVRLQCEREVRAKLLHLRRGYIDAEGRAGDLLRVLQRGHASLVALLRGMLFLQGGRWNEFGEAFDRSCTEKLNVSFEMLARVRAQRFARKPSSAEQLKADYADLLAAIERLALETDRWVFPDSAR